MRPLGLSLVVLVAIAPFQLPADPPAFLADARAALGGDTALNAVAAFTVRGSESRDIGPVTTSSAIDISVLLPDKFLHVTHQSIERGPLGTSQITRYEGFNGNDPIFDVVAPDLPFPTVIPGGAAPTTPAEIAAARTRQLRARQHAFVEMMLPLFASSWPAYPLAFAASTAPDAFRSTIAAKGPDDFTWRLAVDPVTHRIATLAWDAKPFVTASVTSTVAVSSRGQVLDRSSGPPPFGDPTVGLADVPWVVTLSDYRTEDGLTWPHRFLTTVDGKKHADVRLGKYKINPKIDPKIFNRRK